MRSCGTGVPAVDFIAIDFETANQQPSSVCSVGAVMVQNGQVADSFYSLIQPGPNYYSYFCQRVHGLCHDRPIHPINRSSKQQHAYIAIDLKYIQETIKAHNSDIAMNRLASVLSPKIGMRRPNRQRAVVICRYYGVRH